MWNIILDCDHGSLLEGERGSRRGSEALGLNEKRDTYAKCYCSFVYMVEGGFENRGAIRNGIQILGPSKRVLRLRKLNSERRCKYMRA